MKYGSYQTLITIFFVAYFGAQQWDVRARGLDWFAWCRYREIGSDLKSGTLGMILQ